MSKKQSSSRPPKQPPADPALPVGQDVTWDPLLLSRMLLGALSEYEQRQLFARLLRADSALRGEFVRYFEPFEVEKLSKELSQREAALAAGGAAQTESVPAMGSKSKDLEKLLRLFTFRDLFQLGDVTKRFFTLRMAEHLLSSANGSELDWLTRRTRFFMAGLVIDGLEILAAAGMLPSYPRVIASLRGRLQQIAIVLHPTRGNLAQYLGGA